MKKILYLPAILFLTACSHKPVDKKAELADLKKQQADLNSKIAALQAKDRGIRARVNAITLVMIINEYTPGVKSKVVSWKSKVAFCYFR